MVTTLGALASATDPALSPYQLFLHCLRSGGRFLRSVRLLRPNLSNDLSEVSKLRHRSAPKGAAMSGSLHEKLDERLPHTIHPYLGRDPWSRGLSIFAVLVSIITATANAYLNLDASKTSAALTYARGFFNGLNADVLEKYYNYRSHLNQANEAGNILSPDEALVIYLYLDQALKCVEQGRCDQTLFCDSLGADMDTLLLHYENAIDPIMEFNYPKGAYLDHSKDSLADLCSDIWSNRSLWQGSTTSR